MTFCSRWTGQSDAHAAVVGLTLESHERLVQLARAVRRELPAARPLLPLRDHRADDLGDHVAGLVHDHRVADPHVLARDLVLVVQRRQPDRRAADEDRLEHARTEWRDPVRPMLTMIPLSVVVFSSGGNL